MYFAEPEYHAASLHWCFANESRMAPLGAEAWPLRWQRAPDAASFFEQPLQPAQVALHKSGVGGELRVGHAGLAKESKQQLAAAAVGDQSHRDVNALAGGADDGMVDNPDAVPRRELHPGGSAVRVGEPAVLWASDVPAQAEGPLVPFGGIDEKLIDFVARPVDGHGDDARFDSDGLGAGGEGRPAAAGAAQYSHCDGATDDSAQSLHA